MPACSVTDAVQKIVQCHNTTYNLKAFHKQVIDKNNVFLCCLRCQKIVDPLPLNSTLLKKIALIQVLQCSDKLYMAFV